MLFLALGFLDYPDQPNSDRIFSAPLISIPVGVLRRESAGSQVSFLQYTGDDISENLSLREKLKTDHSMILPPLDEDQIDVEESTFPQSGKSSCRALGSQCAAACRSAS